jgi:cell wall-associated NlpC family hydrolase
MASYLYSMRYLLIILSSVVLLTSCSSSRKAAKKLNEEANTHAPAKNNAPTRVVNTHSVAPDDVVDFAETLKGVKYKYGSVKKENGFDCSGFITYVFNHFDIKVPRQSVDFTNTGTTVPLLSCKRGDLILFTGSDTTGWIVGHMGIILENKKGKVKFIHSSSGHNIGVIVSDLAGYYAVRFVKVVRVFN